MHYGIHNIKPIGCATFMVNNGKHQKVMPLDEVEKYLSEGWEYVIELPKNRAIIKMPF